MIGSIVRLIVNCCIIHQMLTFLLAFQNDAHTSPYILHYYIYSGHVEVSLWLSRNLVSIYENTSAIPNAENLWATVLVSKMIFLFSPVTWGPNCYLSVILTLFLSIRKLSPHFRGIYMVLLQVSSDKYPLRVWDTANVVLRDMDFLNSLTLNMAGSHHK